MVHRLLPLAGRLEDDAQVLHQLGLADELVERTGPESGLFDLLDTASDDRRHQTRLVIRFCPGPFGRRIPVGRQNLPAGPRAHRLANSRKARRSISSTPTSSRKPSSAPRISSGA